MLGFRKVFFFFNIVLTWKIMRASKVSVLYIYIYIYIDKSEAPCHREELKVGHGLQLCIPFEEKYLVKLSHRMFLSYLIDLICM